MGAILLTFHLYLRPWEMAELCTKRMLQPAAHMGAAFANWAVVIRPLEDVVEEQRMTTEKGRVMQQMYHVQVIGTWYEDLIWHERIAETWRYARLYQQ